MANATIGIDTHQNSAGSYEAELLINHQPLRSLLSELTGDSTLLELDLAWDKKLTSQAETTYIQALLQQKSSGNVPLLLCPDDLDFSCTIIVVDIHYAETTVHWGRLGYVSKDHYVLEDWLKSGYMNYETWTPEDCERYAEDYFFKDSQQIDWPKLWSLEWLEEELRRVWNYYHPYFNGDANIEWLTDLDWSFPAADYNKALKQLSDLSIQDSF